MDIKLLKEVFSIPSKSTNEEKMIAFVSKKLDKMNIEYTIDKLGNIYNINNKKLPLLCAHMDTVQTDIDVNLVDLINFNNGMIVGEGVIGGDDKCGVYIILDLLKNNHKVNFLFSVREEIGCDGAIEFITNNDITGIPYGLILDRNGNSDIICYEDEYGTKEFEEVLLTIGKVFGFSKARGVLSDADVLSSDISCANISVGYYKAHTKDEYVILSDLQNTLNFIHHILNNVKETFSPPHKRFNFIDIKDEINGDYNIEFNHCNRCGKITDRMANLESFFQTDLCYECLTELKWEVDSAIQNLSTYDNFLEEDYTDFFNDDELEEYYG